MKLINRIARVAAFVFAAATLAISCNKGPTAISISPSSLTIVEGETAPLVASILPEDAKFSAVKWTSSDATVATVTNGLVTAVKAGSATITASTEGVSGTASVTVLSKTTGVTLISLNKIELAMTVGAKETLVATIEPANATNKNVTWKSSNDKVVTVDQSGNVEAVAAGTADVTVTTEDGGKVARCVITVTAKTIAVTGVSLDAKSMTMTEGETAKLIATITPADATNKELEWVSSDDKVVSVDKDGNLKALKAGTSNITVFTKDGNHSDMCAVTVKASHVAVTEVKLDAEELTLEAGETGKLTATVYPDDATNKDVEWVSSDASVVSVDKDGNLKALKEGTSNITVFTKDGNKSDMCKVTVKAKFIAISSIAITPLSISISGVGNTASIHYSVTPSNATESVLLSVSDPTVCTIDENGLITSTGPGDAVISIQSASGAAKSICRVYVTTYGLKVLSSKNEWVDAPDEIHPNSGAYSVTSKEVQFKIFANTGTSETEAAFTHGEKLTCTYSNSSVFSLRTVTSSGSKATIYGKYGNAGVSNYNIVLESSNGTELLNFNGSANVAAENVDATGISVSPTSCTIGAGSTKQLTATVTPSNATDKNVSWKSANTYVATVSPSGLVKGINPGTTTITATTANGKYSKSCTVTVQEIKITNVTFTENPINMYGIGMSKQVKYTVTPLNASEALSFGVPSNETDIITAYWDGEIVSRGYGKATLYASTDDKFWTVPVNVWRPTITILRKDFSDLEPPMSIIANSSANWLFSDNTLTIYLYGYIGTERKLIPLNKKNVTVTISDSSMFSYSLDTIGGGVSPVVEIKCLRSGVGDITIKYVDDDKNVILNRSLNISCTIK